MVERRNHPFSFTIYFYAARGRIARVIAVRQTLWKENLIYREGFFFFGMHYSSSCIGGRLGRARSEMESERVHCPRGWGIFTERGSSVGLLAGLLGQEKSPGVWLWMCKQAPRSPFGPVFSSSSITQPAFILPFAPRCTTTTGATEPVMGDLQLLAVPAQGSEVT